MQQQPDEKPHWDSWQSEVTSDGFLPRRDVIRDRDFGGTRQMVQRLPETDETLIVLALCQEVHDFVAGRKTHVLAGLMEGRGSPGLCYRFGPASAAGGRRSTLAPGPARLRGERQGRQKIRGRVSGRWRNARPSSRVSSAIRPRRGTV